METSPHPSEATADNVEQKLEYKPADLNSRMLASVIDMALIMLLLWPFLMQLSSMVNGPYNPQDIANAFAALPNLGEAKRRVLESGVLKRYLFDSTLQIVTMGLVIVPFWVKIGATPGKYLLRMRVVDSQTLKPISTTHAILRYVCYASCILTLGIGILWVGLNKKKQGFHDLLAGTRVIILPKGHRFV
jgi:uncharacterized RDD family membrane protein YckC